MNSYSGDLIVVEGIDGSGKGTAINNIKSEFPEFEYTAEPSSGKYGRIVREELQSDSDPTSSDFFLFCADRFDHCESLIGPKLEEGKTVLSDRYHLSTFAYQSRVIDEEMDTVDPFEYIDKTLGQFVIEPDLTILIDAPVDTILDRLDEDREKYEKRDRLEEARRIYQYCADEYDFVKVIDGTNSEDRVAYECIETIHDFKYES